MSQKTDGQLLTQAGVIKTETIKEANTCLRNGVMLEDLIGSKINNDKQGVPGGVPILDDNGKVPESMLPEADSDAEVSGTYKFDTGTTAADPGAGRLRINTASFATATKIYINSLSQGGINVSFMIEHMAAGDKMRLQLSSNDENNAIYNLSSPAVNNTGWWTLTVTNDSLAGALFANNADIIATVFITGTGAVVADGDETHKGVYEEATVAQVIAGTLIGETGAHLVVVPSKLHSYRSLTEIAITLAGTTYNLNFGTQVEAIFNVATTIAANCTVTVTSTNGKSFLFQFAVTGTVAFTMPSSFAFESGEIALGRWNAATKVLTLVGATATEFEIVGFKRGSIWKCISSKYS